MRKKNAIYNDSDDVLGPPLLCVLPALLGGEMPSYPHYRSSLHA